MVKMNNDDHDDDGGDDDDDDDDYDDGGGGGGCGDDGGVGGGGGGFAWCGGIYADDLVGNWYCGSVDGVAVSYCSGCVDSGWPLSFLPRYQRMLGQPQLLRPMRQHPWLVPLRLPSRIRTQVRPEKLPR